MLKVIIVEDMKYIRRGLVMTTPWADFACMVAGEAESGEEALQLIKKIQPDIVITDIRMKNMDGLELIRQAKKICESEYIIISGYDEFQYAQQALKLGVRGYLLKPIDDADLYTMMQEATQNIRNKRLYRQVMHQFESGQQGRFHLGEELVRMSQKNKYLDSAIRILQARYSEELNIKNVADEIHISQGYLVKLFREHTGYTFLDALTIFRIQKSIRLLENENMRIYEIAQLVGYKDSRYFSDVFRKVVGLTPTEYRNGKPLPQMA